MGPTRLLSRPDALSSSVAFVFVLSVAMTGCDRADTESESAELPSAESEPPESDLGCARCDEGDRDEDLKLTYVWDGEACDLAGDNREEAAQGLERVAGLAGWEDFRSRPVRATAIVRLPDSRG